MLYAFLIIALILLYLNFKPSKKPSWYDVDWETTTTQNTYLWKEPAKSRIGYECVGESNYQKHIANLPFNSVLDAYLIPEDHNPYDNNAVRIDINKSTAGYLAKADAKKFRKALDKKGLQGKITRCKAQVIGGHMVDGLKMSYGIELFFKEIEGLEY